MSNPFRHKFELPPKNKGECLGFFRDHNQIRLNVRSENIDVEKWRSGIKNNTSTSVTAMKRIKKEKSIATMIPTKYSTLYGSARDFAVLNVHPSK